MKSSRKNETLVFLKDFSWAQPLDLQASLRVRDGLMEEPATRIPRHVLQTIRAQATRDRKLHLN